MSEIHLLQMGPWELRPHRGEGVRSTNAKTNTNDKYKPPTDGLLWEKNEIANADFQQVSIEFKIPTVANIGKYKWKQ